MKKTIKWYLDKGFELKYAKYFVNGIRKIKKIYPKTNFSIDILFDNGEIKSLDCKDLKSKLSLDEFMNAYLNFGTITFNEKIDICPDYSYVESISRK